MNTGKDKRVDIVMSWSYKHSNEQHHINSRHVIIASSSGTLLSALTKMTKRRIEKLKRIKVRYLSMLIV